MSHIQSHHDGARDATHDTILVLMKIHGHSIHLWSCDKMKTIGKSHSFRVACHNVETHSDLPGSNIHVLTLSEPAPTQIDECKFQEQEIYGQHVTPNDLVIFMTGPMSSSRKVSYAIDLNICKGGNNGNRAKGSTLNDLTNINLTDHTLDQNEAAILNDTTVDKIGTSYLYLDPCFSSQGIQRTPIIATNTQVPIGQIQVEYLIVTNPVAYGQPASRPAWLQNKRTLQAGHRGAGSGRRTDLPERLLENTIDSFNYAHRNGADMCELDVLVSADGVPVVYHDFDVDAVAAQQSSEQLGKFRVQVNQLTVKQLRDFRLLALHDCEGCPYTLNVPNQAESNRPFPSLAEVLEQVDETCGLNIEVKWPQLLESGRMEAKRFHEINDFVDKIINVVETHAGNRRVVLESFDADLVVMLRLKQTRFPVMFLCQGMTDRYERYVDTRARSLHNAIYFAQAFDIVGIDLIADYYESMGKELVEFIQAHNLVARGWGDMGDTSERLDALEALGIQCVTYDRIDLLMSKNARSKA